MGIARQPNMQCPSSSFTSGAIERLCLCLRLVLGQVFLCFLSVI